MRLALARFGLLLTLLAPASTPATAAPATPPFRGVPEQQVLRISPQPGLRAAPVGDYTSPAMATEQPFTHLLIRREAHIPVGAQLAIEVRASVDGSNWTDWQTVGSNDDLWVTSDGPDVRWSDTVAVGAVAQEWQVRAHSIAAPDGSEPNLTRIDVNTVDTRLSSQQEQAQNQAMADSLGTRATISKPSVVSRTAWGSPDGQGSRATPAYYPVNHMVIHHTADKNTLVGSEQSWADRVRAEWSFHTITRGWGDVGYNYLIDPNGVIYEGRAGGDDAVGFHDTANYGSMGVSVIGTYSEVQPTQASQQSLIQLLAWKAAQKKIDPLGSSYYYGCAISKYCAPVTKTNVISNIAGHRQVTPGHTTCPGDAFMAIMPRIRHDVAAMLAGIPSAPPDNGDLQVDEFESGFSKTNAQWYSATCGEGGNTFYTYATDTEAESTNSATWRPTIANAGNYHVYVAVPQNCGLAAPPYASSKAKYVIQTADGPVERTVDHNTADPWVDLGVFRFSAGTSASVTLSDLTGEPYSARKVVFYDAVKWVADDGSATKLDLVDVQFAGTDGTNPVKVHVGELLKVTFTVRNSGSTIAYTQEPQASLAPNGLSYNAASSSDSDDSYVYDEGECFLGDGSATYAVFPKETNRIRVALGPTSDTGISCVGNTGGYPWRWGLNGELKPGETRQIIGYVRFRNAGNVTLQAGIIQEYVGYLAQNPNPATITVLPEQQAPVLPEFDSLLQPLARVYKLGSIPSNFLARTSNSLSITRGSYVGSFRWNGAFTDWGAGGPLGATGLVDSFLIEQSRAFLAPIAGVYTFRTTSDDGSWLWIDGKQVVANYGLHSSDDPVTGTLELSAGVHTVAFKYFERSGYASAGYEMQVPGGSSFQALPDGTANGALALGSIYVQTPRITLAADDLGGVGVARYRWSWDGTTWIDSDGRMLEIPALQNGSYQLRYQSFDMQGTASEVNQLNFVVDTNRSIRRIYTPLNLR